MIVICTKCKAKFRVADDRVGPRGAKVRCSRCQTVFHVRPDSAAEADPSGAPSDPGIALELERPRAAGVVWGPPPPSPDVDPFAAAGFGVALAAAASDPFGAPAGDPFAPAPAADPFAPAPAADPFAPAPAADPFAPGPPVDAFAAAAPMDAFAAADPFAPPAEPRSGPGGGLALTDVADLLGSVPAPGPIAPAAPAAVVPPPLPPPLPTQAPADDGGLALEDRVTPPPLASRAPLDADALLRIRAGDGFSVSDPQAFGGFELGEGPGDAPLGLATDAAEAAEPAVAPAAAPPEPEPVAPLPPAPAPRQPPMGASAPLADRLAQPRASRLRAVVVNAIAIVALLAVALAMLVVWREGRVEAASLRPSAILAALGAGGASGPFAAVEVRSGVYDRERAPPLLFVRGKVVSRAAAPVRGVTISVEVVRDDRVIARGEALAGAIPTPEELYHANDAAAVAALARTAGARAPAAVRPGEAVPFLVAIADHPSDLEGASLRVEVAEARGTAR